MGKRIALFAATLVAAFALCAQDAKADTIEHDIIHGTEGNVSYSWLTQGSNTSGQLGSGDHKWRIYGAVDFLYSSSLDSISDASGTVDVKEYDGSAWVKVGEITFTDADFGNSDAKDTSGGSLLGVFDVTFTVTDATSDFADAVAARGSATVGFADTTYYGSSFNSFNAKDIRLWGNEQIYDSSLEEATNWGFDWASVSEVPEPGSIVLLGLGVVGFAVVRRRRQQQVA